MAIGGTHRGEAVSACSVSVTSGFKCDQKVGRCQWWEPALDAMQRSQVIRQNMFPVCVGGDNGLEIVAGVDFMAVTENPDCRKVASILLLTLKNECAPHGDRAELSQSTPSAARGPVCWR
jgi:hypothetical protein